MLHDWHDLFQGELSASAALCGLIFVSLSVNQRQILSLERMADRGIESLAILFLVLVLSSVALVPNCGHATFGIESVGLGTVVLGVMVRIQRGYLRHLDAVHRRTTRRMAWFSRSALGTVIAGGGLLIGGTAGGLYLVLLGILLGFLAAGVNAWVLLVEINR